MVEARKRHTVHSHKRNVLLVVLVVNISPSAAAGQGLNGRSRYGDKRQLDAWCNINSLHV